jgi:uncharacterized protein
MKNNDVKNVDGYIANSTKEARPHLEELRRIIKSTVRGAEEGINWGFPFYKYRGTLAHFAEYKLHVALGFGSDLQSKDREVLEKKGYAIGQKRIQIKFNQNIPEKEIRQILKAQAKMNESKKVRKQGIENYINFR